MKNKKLYLIFTCVLAVMFSSASAARYKILYINTGKVTLGNKTLKVGDTFTDNDKAKIVWSSNNQAIKARNEDTKRNIVFTKHNIGEKVQRPLFDYLTKKKGLWTRSFSFQKRDTIIQLLDTAEFVVSGVSKNNTKFISVWKEGGISVRNPLTLSNDGTRLYLTRIIYGHHEPRTANIRILKYDLQKNSSPDTLGWLRVIPLPLH